MSWTDERVSLLKKLWTEGKTAAEIAKELGGVTRNAVIGKAHRLKLSGRVSPIQQNKKVVKKVKPKPRVKAKVIERGKSGIDAANKNTNTKSEKVVKAPPAPVNVVSIEDAQREKVAMVDLVAKQCRWPIGDPRHEAFGFCGDTTLSGLPYCKDHAMMAYQAATRNRILKEEEAEIAKVRRQLEKKAGKRA